MDDLIEALEIFRSYGNPYHPTHCEHDALYVCIDPDDVPENIRDFLETLNFIVSDTGDCFVSYRFGST